MSSGTAPTVAIVDYGMGNLFSVRQACEHAGLHPIITSSPREVADAGAVILPGVGAFGDAMASLERRDLVSPLRDISESNKPLLGICLGMQLLMTESQEFGQHQGLGIIEGQVTQLRVSQDGQRALKVPQVGWNQIKVPEAVACEKGENPWAGTLWDGLTDGEYMYFVHSYYAAPNDGGLSTSLTRYGDNEFCSSLRRGNVSACQFHPERSGHQGMRVYQNLVEHLIQQTSGRSPCLNP